MKETGGGRIHRLARTVAANKSASHRLSEQKEDAVANSDRYDFRALDWGAQANGLTDDTAAIQRAIDACAAAGGGRVLLHNGRFLTGTLRLRSRVDLHLTATATLLGAKDLARYPRDGKTAYRHIDRALVLGEGCENVAITGDGVIDGQGAAFATDRGEAAERPVLIRLRDCRNVRIEGILLKDAAVFALHPIHCRHVRIEGLRIDSRVMPNADGIDLDGCQDVFIANCQIASEDDSIALKSIEPGAPCRDVVITNCILSSRCAAIRIGPDARTDIERVTVSNCIIRDTGLNGIKIQGSYGVRMSDMVFSNIVMDNVAGLISLRLAGWKTGADAWAVTDDSNWEAGRLENILFANIRGRARDVRLADLKLGMSITGTPKTRPRRIMFSNVDFTFPGGGTAQEAARRDVPENERCCPECSMFGVLPAYGLYLRHAEEVVLNNVLFRLDAPDLRPAIVADDVEDLELAGFKAEGNAGAESLVRLRDARRVFINHCRPLNAVGAFLRVEGAASEGIEHHGTSTASPDPALARVVLR